MKTFTEFLTGKGWFENADATLVATTLSKLGKQDPTMIPGAATPQQAAHAMKMPAVKSVIRKKPALAGEVGQALTGANPGVKNPNIGTGI